VAVDDSLSDKPVDGSHENGFFGKQSHSLEQRALRYGPLIPDAGCDGEYNLHLAQSIFATHGDSFRT
jgi:hypothetical protein